MTTESPDELGARVEEVDTSGCIQVVNDEDPPLSRPLCEIAREVALGRKAALDAVGLEVRAALADIDGGAGTGAVAARLRLVSDVIDADPGPELVSHHDLLRGVVLALENEISAAPSDLLECAIAVTRALSSDGWIVVRAQGQP